MSEANFYIRAKDATAEAFKSLSSNLGVAKGAANNLNGLLGLLGVSASAAGALLAMKSAIEGADHIGKLAQKTGLTTEEVSKYQYAAQLSDVSTETFAAGVRALNNNIVEQDKTLKSLGITSKDTNEVILQLADVFAKMPDGAEKSALAVKLFGRAGTEMIPLLNSGSAGIKAMGDELQRFGGVVDTETARVAEKLNDDLNRLKVASQGVTLQIAKYFIPALTDASNNMVDATKQAGLLTGVLEGLRTIWARVFYGDTDKKTIAQKLIDETNAALKAKESALQSLTNTPTSIYLSAETKAALLAKNKQEIDLLKTNLADKKKIMDSYNKEEKEPETKKTTDNVLSQDNKKKFDAAKAALDIAKSSADAELKIIRASQSAANEAYESAYRQGVISEEQYHTAKLAVLQVATEREMAILQARKTQLENYRPKDQADTVKIQEEIGKVSADMDELTIKASASANTMQGEINTAIKKGMADIDGSLRTTTQSIKDWQSGANEAFQEFSQRAGDDFTNAKNAATTVFNGMSEALVDFVRTGKLDFKSFADSIIADLARIIIQKQLAGILGGLFGGTGDAPGSGSNYKFSDASAMWAKGGAFGGTGVIPFAKGGAFTHQVVDRPTPFAFARGGKFGVMGEAGPEAILPLQRDASGNLGVRASGDGGASAPEVHINITNNGTPQTATRTNTQFNGKDFVIGIVMEDLQRNGPLAQTLKRM